MDIICSNCGYIWENISHKIILLYNDSFRCKKCIPNSICNDYQFVHDRFELGWKFKEYNLQIDDDFKTLKDKRNKSFIVNDIDLDISNINQNYFYIDKQGNKHTNNIKEIINKDLFIKNNTNIDKSNTFIKCIKCKASILSPIHIAGESLPPIRCKNCNPSTNFTKYKWDGRTWRCVHSINDIPIETIRSYLLSHGIKCKGSNKQKLLEIIKDIDSNLLNINKYTLGNTKIPSFCQIKLINSIPKNKDIGFIIRI